MKSFFKVLENILIVLLTFVLYFNGSILSMFLGIPVLLIFSSKLYNVISHNRIKDSIFSVSKKGVIKQNSLAEPVLFLKLLCTKDKENVFLDEALKMFMQLCKTNDKGDVINYSTVSHGLTYRLLKKMEIDGYITNLKREKLDRRKLLFEKLLIGNTKGVNNKYQMYKINFCLTDKKYEENGLNDNQSSEILVCEDKKNRVSEIRELQALKNQLLNDSLNVESNLKRR